MKLIKPTVEIIEQGDDLFKHIELCGRICYKSEDKITDDSAKDFVQMLINKGHTAMLEHATVYLKIKEVNSWVNKYLDNHYSKAKSHLVEKDNKPYCHFITTNYRVLLENNWLDDLKYICQPTEHHQKRISVRFVCDRGVSHELVRHRVFSFAQESTRYCNYSKDKFNNEITFISPNWLGLSYMTPDWYGKPDPNLEHQAFYHILEQCEKSYLRLLELGWQPQQARAVLPTALKTEVVMTGFVSDWEHFFTLRTSKAAHPQMRELAVPLYQEFSDKII